MIVVAGLVLAFVLILIFANRDTRHCRWREDRRQGGPEGARLYRCMACGAVAQTETGQPPRTCYRRRGPPSA
jgi:hypothetical protein